MHVHPLSECKNMVQKLRQRVEKVPKTRLSTTDFHKRALVDCEEKWKGIQLLTAAGETGTVVYQGGSEIKDVENEIKVALETERN